jgi:site-specific DNA-methyltransferase (adenine-specific)
MTTWPDSYLIPGVKPYFQEEAGIIYCGDCRDILPHLPDASIDMIFTDPPYGHNNNNDGDLIANWEKALGRGEPGKPRPIANDGKEAEELAAYLFQEAPRLLRRGGCCCCCCGGGPDPMFARWSLEMDKHLEFKQMIVWDKGPMGMGWHYRRSYETVLVGQKRGGACKWYDSSDRIENIIRPGAYGIRKIIPSADQHPTEKPVQLAAHFIGLHSEITDIVFDPFMGHGTTLQAAKELGRRYIGIEIEEKYCEIAVKRLKQCNPLPFTEPKKPKKQQGSLI